ncbi:MAG: phenylalanine 4-monooxygenase [Acidimicrobiales bacterium]
MISTPNAAGDTAVEEPLEYQARRATIASLATGPAQDPVDIDYLPHEHETWETVMAQLHPLWDRHVAQPLHTARDNLDLPTTEVPQLTLVSHQLKPITGFRYASVAGTVSATDFFAALASQTFPSTQFIRWSGDPLYTPQPDVIHEVGGHATSLATPQLAELHRLAGLAAAAAPARLAEIAAVFWYTIEFGVVAGQHGPKAYGTGLLSSPGELAWFKDNASIRPLNIQEMIATSYDISTYQPVLFAADSLDHVLDVAGGYFKNTAGGYFKNTAGGYFKDTAGGYFADLATGQQEDLATPQPVNTGA